MYSQNMNFGYNFHPDQNADPSSPEIFKQNLRVVQDQVIRLRVDSRRALAGIKNAYHVGNNPSQTQADVETVKQSLIMIADLMRQSGIGALPLLEPDTNGQTQPPTESQLLERAEKGVQVYFEKLKRAQESAAVVANLLGSDHRMRGL